MWKKHTLPVVATFMGIFFWRHYGPFSRSDHPPPRFWPNSRWCSTNMSRCLVTHVFLDSARYSPKKNRRNEKSNGPFNPILVPDQDWPCGWNSGVFFNTFLETFGSEYIIWIIKISKKFGIAKHESYLSYLLATIEKILNMRWEEKSLWFLIEKILCRSQVCHEYVRCSCHLWT